MPWIGLLINVATVAQNVHRLFSHMHEDGYTTHQLLCQWCSGPCHAKCAANTAAVRRYYLPV